MRYTSCFVEQYQIDNIANKISDTGNYWNGLRACLQGLFFIWQVKAAEVDVNDEQDIEAMAHSWIFFECDDTAHQEFWGVFEVMEKMCLVKEKKKLFFDRKWYLKQYYWSVDPERDSSKFKEQQMIARKAGKTIRKSKVGVFAESCASAIWSWIETMQFRKCIFLISHISEGDCAFLKAYPSKSSNLSTVPS